MRVLSVAILLAVAGTLTACGGGGGDGGGGPSGGGAVSGSDVPSSALQSSDGLVAYLKQLIAGTSDSTEPVALGDVTLPQSDTTEPASVN
jgi:hypothetical protein